ncbi:GLUG motif-containing protein [Oscillospiraceae bacterium LTW-04]|nr:GLUG motif-containing protein [Oscillospiraceae bacterium MB24-C1]
MLRFNRLRSFLLAALLILACACQKPGTSSSQPAPEVPSPASSALSDMLFAAEIYEDYCGGLDWDGTDYSATVGYAYGWLLKNDLLDALAKDDTQGETLYTLPQPIAEVICDLYFGVDIAPKNEQYALTYSTAYDDVTPPYVLKGPTELPAPEADGSYLLTLARVTPDGDTLRSVRYHFVPKVLQEELTAPVSRVHHKNDTVWQLAAVTNLSEPALPKAQYKTVRISTVDELLQMASAVNSGDRQAQQKRYLLEADLDLEGISFPTIGVNRPLLPNDIRDDSPQGFNAVFDGQGYTIRNVSITLTAPESPDAPLVGGFFSVIGPGGEVQNLTLENASVSTPVTAPPAAGEVATGLLAGRCMGQVSDCHVSGKVVGYYKTGGFAGFIGNYQHGDEASFARVTNCTAKVSVAGDSELGGFAGSLHGAILSDCTVEGDVVAVSGQIYGAPRAIGGFCGFSVEGRVENCEASVYVKTMLPAEWVGAFMGYNQGAIINSRYNLDKAPYWEPVDVIYNNAISEVTAFSSNVKPLCPT